MIETVTTDFPGLQDDISRMSQALELLGDWTTPKVDRPAVEEMVLETETVADEISTPSPTPQPEPQAERPEQQMQETATRTFFDEEPARRSRSLLYSLLVIILLVGAAAGANY